MVHRLRRSWSPCLPGAVAATIGVSGLRSFPVYRTRASLLGGRSTVGHVALDHVIGVRIPASQPAFARASRELRLGGRVIVRPSLVAHASTSDTAKAVAP